MTFIDLIIAFMVLIGMWRGYRAGAIKTAMTLIGWFVALVLASIFAKPLSGLFADMVASSVLQISMAFLTIVLIVVTMTHLLCWVLSGMLNLLKLGFLDKIGGAILGSGKGLLKVLIILSVASPLLTRLPNWQNSILANELLPFAPVAKTLITKTLGEAWNQIENPYQ